MTGMGALAALPGLNKAAVSGSAFGSGKANSVGDIARPDKQDATDRA